MKKRELIDQPALLALLRAEVQASGGQAGFARRADVSQAYVADLLAGKRSPGPKILRAMGLERVTMYRPVSGEDALTEAQRRARNNELR